MKGSWPHLTAQPAPATVGEYARLESSASPFIRRFPLLFIYRPKTPNFMEPDQPTLTPTIRLIPLSLLLPLPARAMVARCMSVSISRFFLLAPPRPNIPFFPFPFAHYAPPATPNLMKSDKTMRIDLSVDP